MRRSSIHPSATVRPSPLAAVVLVGVVLLTYLGTIGPVHGQPSPVRGVASVRVFLPMIITDPASIILEPVSVIAGRATTVSATDTFAYVGLDTTFSVFDMSQPANPRRVGQYPLKGSLAPTATSIQLVGSLAYVTNTYVPSSCCQLGTLDIIDISNPVQPVSRGSFDGPGFSDVAVVDQRAYVTAAYRLSEPYKLTILDVNNSSQPVELGRFGQNRGSAAVAVSGTTAVIADYWTGLLVANVQDPQAPALLATLDTPGSAYDVQVQSTLAYVADGDAGLHIVDISDPSRPAARSSTNLDSRALKLQVKGTLAYIAAGDNGVYVVNVGNPNAPRIVGHYATPSPAVDIAVQNDLVYVATREGGLHILRQR